MSDDRRLSLYARALLQKRLIEFIEHRANAAKIAKENGGEFGYLPGHPHEFLDASSPAVARYLFEANASILALRDAGVISGDRQPSKPEFIEVHVCECCQKVVIPVPGDLRRGQPVGSMWVAKPTAGPIGRARREAIYDYGNSPPKGAFPCLT